MNITRKAHKHTCIHEILPIFFSIYILPSKPTISIRRSSTKTKWHIGYKVWVSPRSQLILHWLVIFYFFFLVLIKFVYRCHLCTPFLCVEICTIPTICFLYRFIFPIINYLNAKTKHPTKRKKREKPIHFLWKFMMNDDHFFHHNFILYFLLNKRSSLHIVLIGLFLSLYRVFLWYIMTFIFLKYILNVILNVFSSLIQ